MGTTYTETELLEKAMRALEMETGFRIQVRAREVLADGYCIDAIVQIDGDKPMELKAEIKAWAQHVNTGALINQVGALGQNGILVTDYVNPRLAEKLKDHDIKFMDTAGNAFIKAPGIYIYIKGKKLTGTALIPGGGQTRLFNTTGLKVAYTLLCDPDMVNAPYRNIADQADVALGTVSTVMRDLRRGGFLVERDKQRRLRNYEKLLDRWVETYPEKLRPKLLIGQFLAENPNWWKELQITNFNAQWGGEIAAARYTNLLKPEIATLYIQEPACIGDLIRAARLRRLDEYTAVAGMEVHIYTRFWNTQDEETELVDPVLTYADLIATADPRNREIALNIREKYIAQRIRKN